MSRGKCCLWGGGGGGGRLSKCQGNNEKVTVGVINGIVHLLDSSVVYTLKILDGIAEDQHLLILPMHTVLSLLL